MRFRKLASVLTLTLATLPVVQAQSLFISTAPVRSDDIRLQLLGRYESGIFEQSAAEIVAHDPATQRLFVVKATAAAVDVLDIRDPRAPRKVGEIDASPYGAGVNSVGVRNGVVALAVENANKQQPGKVAFFTTTGRFLSAVTVGALPDMLTWTSDGRKVVVANEGEPSSDYTVDPEGSVSVVDVSRGAAKLTAANVTTIGFADFNVGGPRHAELDPAIRIFGPNATVAQDVEPEYIAVAPDGRRAWVTLQENNALALLDLTKNRVERVVAQGAKDYSSARSGLDASDKDGTIAITTQPVRGLYQADALAAYQAGGATYIVTANEGDGRAYDAYNEEARVGALTLDAERFPNAAALQNPSVLGRLTVTTASGNTDADPQFEELYAFGTRSFSIRDASGALVFDSGDDFERITASVLPADFNADHAENGSFDSRSDNKGPEPEGATVGKIGNRTYAFIGLERVGGVMVYDVTQPSKPRFVQYFNSRNFAGDPAAGTAGDLGPEGLTFIPASVSPNGEALLVVAHEVSGSTAVYQIDTPDDDHDDDEDDD